MNSILIFDTETTGLLKHPDAPLHKQPKIIEFGGVLLNREGFEIEEEVSILINPGEPLSVEIVKITGITDADLVDAVSFDQALPMLNRIFAEASAVVAHNLPFDRGIIQNELKRRGITDFPWPGKEFCTAGAYREEWGYNPKLKELYAAKLGMPLEQKHRALDDAMAIVEILRVNDGWKMIP